MGVQEVGGILERLAREEFEVEPELKVEPAGGWTWADRLWTVPAERRLGVKEVCEALGRSRTWLYAQMAKDCPSERLPHRKLDGQVLFTAGETRAWLRGQEEAIHGGAMESIEAERKGQFRVS